MNADEGVSLFKMVVTILLVVLIVGAIVGLTYAAYAWFNSGSSKLTDQVSSIDKSAFSQYDDTQISGTDVLSALKTYRESEIAIFILNKNDAGWNDTAYEASAGTTLVAANYCALSSTDAAGTPPTAVPATMGQVPPATLKVGTDLGNTTIGNSWTCEFGLAWQSNGVLSRNTNFSPTTTKKETLTYVNQGSTWYAKLVYDHTTNDICGILFVQMN